MIIFSLFAFSKTAGSTHPIELFNALIIFVKGGRGLFDVHSSGVVSLVFENHRLGRRLDSLIRRSTLDENERFFP